MNLLGYTNILAKLKGLEDKYIILEKSTKIEDELKNKLKDRVQYLMSVEGDLFKIKTRPTKK